MGLRCLVAAGGLLAPSRGANWAQTTGTMQQNTAIPYLPTKQNPHWSARMGHASAMTNVTDNGEAVFRSQPYVFVIGGDDYKTPSDPSFDQHNVEHGLKNDVWRLAAPEPGKTWVVDADMIDRSRYEHKFPKVHSQLEWEQMSQGERPRAGETYEEFIQCQAAYPPQSRQPGVDCAVALNEGEKPRGWFSPRRMHQVAVYGQTLFVVGGRARELMPLHPDRLVGGLVGARDLTHAYSNQEEEAGFFGGGVGQRTEPSFREAVVLKNDVWTSKDWGRSWTLTQPGCHSNQVELLLEDRLSTPEAPKLAEMFNGAFRCTISSDCYGNQESCIDGVCVCDIWSPRAQHRVTVFNGHMYLVGGFASRHLSFCEGRACGDVDAGSYRAYMNDVWVSKLLDEPSDTAGASWVSLSSADFEPRGGHAVAVVEMLYASTIPGASKYALYVFGGQTGATRDKARDRVLNDVWYTVLPDAATDPQFVSQNGWIRAHRAADWAPRTGHVALVDPPSAANGYSQRVFIHGGTDVKTSALYGDTWSWGWECAKDAAGVAYVDGDRGPECSATAGGGTLKNATRWRRDYDPDALWRYDFGGAFIYDEGQPQQFYVDEHSPIEDLVKVYLPLGPTGETFDASYPAQFRASQRTYGAVPRRQRLIREEMLAFMHELDIHTIRDLADISQENILKIRGYIPKTPTSERFGGRYDDLVKEGYFFDAVCDHRRLARAVLKKCAVDLSNHPLIHYDQEAEMPWNVKVEFAGKTPSAEDYDWYARWHGQSYAKPPAKDEATVVAEWDGCSDIGFAPIDVPGIGDVSPAANIKNPEPDVVDLVCRAHPGPRAYHTGLYMDQKLYVMGGLVDTANMTSTQDLWYRDDRVPRTTLIEKPKELSFGEDWTNIFKTAEDDFKMRGDKEGVIFEYLIWDNDEHRVARTWDVTKARAQVNWLDYWFENGPGSGTYIFFARSRDPAGNVDVTYGRANVYKWKYQTALPWHIIGGCIGGFCGLCLFLYWEYKRRQKKKAMERYAIKRMRRKFKGAQRQLADRGGVDWKGMQAEKRDSKKKKKKKKKTTTKKNGAKGADAGNKNKDDKKLKEMSAKDKDKEKAKRRKLKDKEKEKLKKKKE